jgi:hypothetical protein
MYLWETSYEDGRRMELALDRIFSINDVEHFSSATGVFPSQIKMFDCLVARFSQMSES